MRPVSSHGMDGMDAAGTMDSLSLCIVRRSVNAVVSDIMAPNGYGDVEIEDAVCHFWHGGVGPMVGRIGQIDRS